MTLSPHNFQLDQLIEEALDTLHLEAGTAPARGHPVTLRPIIAQVVVGFQAIASNRLFQIALAPDLPFAIGSESKIELALVNLIDSAVALGEPQQPIVISADATDNCVVVTVEGTGSVKDPCHPTDDSTPLSRDQLSWWATLQIKLFVARKLIQAQGGQIWTEISPGTDIRFHFSLPKIEVRDVAQAFTD